MNLQQPGKIDKGWGFEIVWSNNENYCGKLLVFTRVGAKTSMVFHKEKRKSWFVNAGKFKVTYIDVNSGQVKEAILEEGKTANTKADTANLKAAGVDTGSFLGVEQGIPEYLEYLKINSRY